MRYIPGKPNVAPLGPDEAAQEQNAQAQAMELMRTFSQGMGNIPMPAPNPQADIMSTIGAIPEVPPQAGPRGMDLLRSDQTVASPEEAAALAGSSYAPAAQEEVVMDPVSGLPMLDEMGQPVRRAIQTDQYNEQLAAERSGFNNIMDPVARIARDPYNAQGAVRDLLTGQQQASQQANARQQAKSAEFFKDIDRQVDKVGAPMQNAATWGMDALFTERSAAMLKQPDGVTLPAGIALFKKLGIQDMGAAQAIGTMGGIAFNQAVTQIGVEPRRDRATGEVGDAVAPEGTQFYNDIINSTTHFLSNGFKNAGFKIDRSDVEMLSKALVIDAVNRGDLVPSRDPATGRPIAEASSDLKQQSMALQAVSAAMTGKNSRRVSSTTPTPGGALLTSGGPKLTANSMLSPGMVTRAANVTKNILGSVAYIFRAKDLQRKAAELALVFHPDFVVTDNGMPDGQFKFSKHPLAKRNGVHEGAYIAAKLNVKVPEGMEPGNVNHKRFFEQAQEQQALNVMGEKKKTIEFTMQTISNKTGLRYGEFMHSLANQRFFVNSYDLDYMGSKEIIRDVMAMAYQDTVRVDHLFDAQPIEILKRKANWVLNGSGEEIHKNLTGLNPSELGALGAMYNAVLMYYTAVNPTAETKNITKWPLAQAIQLYTPAIAGKLAELGEKYNVFMQDTTQEPDPEMMGLWVASEKGEALGSINVLDDFFRAKTSFENETTKRTSMALSHHAFYDGNQNGIFLQALFFGQKSANSPSDAITRLSQANPDLNDMRVYGFTTAVSNLDDILNDNRDKLQAWRAFWAEAYTRHPEGKDGVAKDFFKKPLMQNAYGKDASMFSDVLYELMQADNLYAELAQKHFRDTMLYGDINDAASDLSMAVEGSLRQLINNEGVQIMKAVGRNFALLDSPIMIQGVTGDTYLITPTGMSLVGRGGRGVDYVPMKVGEQEVLLKKQKHSADTLVNPQTGESMDVPSFAMQYTPQATPGTQRFFNRKTQQYDDFHNPIGITLSRQAVVLMIQALDGDLVKWSTIEANKGLKTPRPITWVHDSIISTPGQSLIYTNMYNNIAIPRAVPEIGKLGQRVHEALKTTRESVVKRVEEAGEPVGIGTNGEFASIGAVFDEIDRKIDINDPAYKERFILRAEARQNANRARPSKSIQSQFNKYMRDGDAKTPEEQWRNYVAKQEAILQEAEKLGWVARKKLPEDMRADIAIPAKSFRRMLALAEQAIGTAGPSSQLNAWFAGFKDRVNLGARTLYNATRRGGIFQMSGSGNKKKASYEKILPDAKVVAPKEGELLVPEKRRAVPPVGTGFDEDIVPF